MEYKATQAQYLWWLAEDSRGWEKQKESEFFHARHTLKRMLIIRGIKATLPGYPSKQK